MPFGLIRSIPTNACRSSTQDERVSQYVAAPATTAHTAAMMARRETVLTIRTSEAQDPQMRDCAIQPVLYKFWLKLTLFGLNPCATRMYFN